MKTLTLLVTFIFLVGCANKKIVLGKRCFEKTTGMYSWSFVWVADKNVIDQKLLKECK
jgi:hypothetical protein